ARASLPCLPITLPTSSGATCSRNTMLSSPAIVSTLTASGSSTSWRAIQTSSSAMALADAGGLDQPGDGVARLCPLGEPILHFHLVELDRGGIGLRVVASHDLDETAVARGTRI